MENLQAYYYNFQQFFFLPNKFDAFNTVSEVFFPLFVATPVAYGSSWARGWIKPMQARVLAMTTLDPSYICELHWSLWQHQILNPVSEAKGWTHILVETMSGS